MNYTYSLLIPVVSMFGVLFAVNFMLKTPKLFANTLKSGAAGLTALTVLNLAAPISGIVMPFNAITLGVSIVAGVPGVGTLAVLNTLLL